MEAITRRMPSRETLERNRGKIAGFAAGVLGPVVAVMLFMALWTGEGLAPDPAPSSATIFPNR